MMSKIFVLIGDSGENGYCHKLAKVYIDYIAKYGHEVLVFDLAKLEFDINLPNRYKSDRSKDILEIEQVITESDLLQDKLRK